MQENLEKFEARLIRLPEVCRLTGLSKSTIYRLKSENRFPQRVLSMAAAKWATGATKWWTTSRVAVGWSGRVGDRIRGCEPTGVLSGLVVDRCVRSLGHGIPAAALEPVALPFVSNMWTWWVSRSSSAPVGRSEPNTSVHSSKGRLVVTMVEPRS